LPGLKEARKLLGLAKLVRQRIRIRSLTIMAKEIAYDLERKYMTQEEVALLFRVSLSTVKNWRDAGLLGYFQPTGSTRVLYPKEAVEEFEKQHTKKAKVLEFKRPAEVQKGKPEVSTKPQKEWRI
jgi:excisionase family DNA binding protein